MAAGLRGLLLVAVWATVTAGDITYDLPAGAPDLKISDLTGSWLDASYGWSRCQKPMITRRRNKPGKLFLQYNHTQVPSGIEKSSPLNHKSKTEWTDKGNGTFYFDWLTGMTITVLELKPRRYVFLHYVRPTGLGYILAFTKRRHTSISNLKQKMYNLTLRDDIPRGTFLFYPKYNKACIRTKTDGSPAKRQPSKEDAAKDNLAMILYTIQKVLLTPAQSRPLSYQNMTYNCPSPHYTYTLLAKLYEFGQESWFEQRWTEERMITLRSVLQECGCRYSTK